MYVLELGEDIMFSSLRMEARYEEREGREERERGGREEGEGEGEERGERGEERCRKIDRSLTEYTRRHWVKEANSTKWAWQGREDEKPADGSEQAVDVVRHIYEYVERS